LGSRGAADAELLVVNVRVKWRLLAGGSYSYSSPKLHLSAATYWRGKVRVRELLHSQLRLRIFRALRHTLLLMRWLAVASKVSRLWLHDLRDALS
jgi:hypothetical protein